MKAKNSKFDLSELCGWVGMVLIHAATLPTSIGVILGYNDRLPPVSMVLMVWSGLFLFLIRALGRNDKLYIISNAVGFFFCNPAHHHGAKNEHGHVNQEAATKANAIGNASIGFL